MEKEIITDGKREATHSMAGYSYQVLQAVLAWIDLQPDESLHLEAGEDFDVEGKHLTTLTQIKDNALSGRATLRTEGVVEAIKNYWTHRGKNPDLI